MREARPWTKDEIATATVMRKRGMTCAQIAEVLGRPMRGVRDRLFRSGVLADLGWTEAQDAILRANLDKTTKQLAQMVSAVGPKRTARGIRTRFHRLKLRADRSYGPAAAAAREAAAYRAGWVSTEGDAAERDEEFVRMVLRGWAELQGLKVAA